MQSKSSSSLILVALTHEDARDWQRNHDELAAEVRVVFIGGAKSALHGSTVTAAYFTYRAGRHHAAEDVADMLEARIARYLDDAAHPSRVSRLSPLVRLLGIRRPIDGLPPTRHLFNAFERARSMAAHPAGGAR